MYLLNKAMNVESKAKGQYIYKPSDMVELISIDLNHQLPGWSLNLDIPQITEDVLFNNPILFYLESADSYLKLPMKNIDMGYSANIYKNVGKVYITFKSLKDDVSNFYVPTWHLTNLKILIVKPFEHVGLAKNNKRTSKQEIYRKLQKSGINIENYNEVLEYFGDKVEINFKRQYSIDKPNQVKRAITSHAPRYLSTS